MEDESFYAPDQVIAGQSIWDGIVWTIHLTIKDEKDLDFWFIIN